METVTLMQAGYERHYLLFPCRGRSGRLPLVLFLAGTGGTAAWAADEVSLPQFAQEAGFHLIVPEALAPEPDRPPKFLTNPPRWNDGSPSPVPGRASNIDDVAFIRAVLADAETRLALDHCRMYVTGFSNGAGMCFRLAIEASERIAAIAPVAGYCPLADDPQPRYPVPTCYLIGTADPLVPPRGGDVVIPWGNRLIRRPPIAEKLAQWAEAIGCLPDPLVEQELRTHRIDRYPSKQRDGAEFLVYLIEGLGHHWPGGKGQLNPRIGGPSVSPLRANVVIWDFFRRHTREHSPH